MRIRWIVGSKFAILVSAVSWAGSVAGLCGGLGLVIACANCPRAGCDALSSPAPDSHRSGIAGVVASESDVVGNGCQECPFGSTQLDVWKTSSKITDAAAAQAIVSPSVAPTVSIQAGAHYDQALDAGTYLVCSRPYCVSVEVVANRVTTVHVKLIFGPAQFVVFDPGSETARSASVFEVAL